MGCFRWFTSAAGSFVKVPFFGAISYLTMAVSPFCVVFAVLWAIYRQFPYAWIAQDILVSAEAICSVQAVSSNVVIAMYQFISDAALVSGHRADSHCHPDRQGTQPQGNAAALEF